MTALQPASPLLIDHEPLFRIRIGIICSVVDLLDVHWINERGYFILIVLAGHVTNHNMSGKYAEPFKQTFTEVNRQLYIMRGFMKGI